MPFKLNDLMYLEIREFYERVTPHADASLCARRNSNFASAHPFNVTLGLNDPCRTICLLIKGGNLPI